ncbi:MAG: peptidylprolyl isomerase [Bacteroidales bacterium]|nr:peptidylprolyl isomerase [Bacteroidales bacterium]
MNRLFITFLLTLLFSLNSCAEEKSTLVLLETEFGTITLKLYDETPKHRDNFIKLVEEGFYNGTLFHRVIDGFMIQGGDPDSKNAPAGTHLGVGGPGYTIDAEIVYPQFFHKKGALAAARQGDQVNPEKKSSGSQFYIVQGEKIEKEDILRIETMKNQQEQQAVFMKYIAPFRQQLEEFQMAGDREGFEKLINQLREDAEEEILQLSPFQLSEAEIEAYTKVGETPQLDGAYTVFGEVVEGLDIIDKIAEVETNASDRPLKDIEIKMSILKK